MRREHLASVRPAGPGNWSPDGKQIAFVWADRSGTPYLWTCSVDGGWPRRVSDQPVAPEMTDGTDRRDIGGGPQWSPCGSQIAFLTAEYANDGVAIATASVDGTSVERITRHVGSDRTPRWSPDGQQLAFVGNRDGRDDIQIVSATGGVALQITYDRWDNTDLEWSPDGCNIAFISQRSDVDLFSNNLCRISPNGGEVVRLTDEESANDRSPRWSPDGQTIAFISNRADIDDIWLIDSDGQNLRRLTEGPGEKGDPRWSPDGQSLAYTVFQRCETDIFITPVAGGEPLQITSGYVNEAPRWSPDGTQLLYLHSGPGEPANLWIAPPESHSTDAARRITDVARGQFSGVPFSEPELVAYRSEDGLEIEGLLYHPVESSDAAGPAIVWVHGGSNASFANGWIPQIQYLVSRGYTILAPNYRGSTGYGKEFMEANMGSRTGADLQDWIAAASRLRELSTVGNEPIAIVGASWGGYATLISLGRAPDVFAAGVAIAAPSNWLSYWEETRMQTWTRRFRVKLMGKPSIARDLYVRQSAETYAANFQAPVLILHGEEDPGVPIGQARGMAAALRRHAKSYEFQSYPGEGHAFTTPEAILDSATRIEQFLDAHLRA